MPFTGTYNKAGKKDEGEKETFSLLMIAIAALSIAKKKSCVYREDRDIHLQGETTQSNDWRELGRRGLGGKKCLGY